MFPPLTTGYEKHGMISEQDLGFYTRLAKGGVGYIVLGDVAPINSFSPTPKLYDDNLIPAFKELADSVHAYGTKLGVQIFHPEYDAEVINDLFNQKKFDEIPPADDRAFSDYLVLRGAVYREEAALQWIQECIKLSGQRSAESKK